MDVALPRMDPTLPVGRQRRSSSCAGNRPLPLQGARGICCFGALAGCRLAARSIIVPTPLGMLGCWLRVFGTTNPCAPRPPPMVGISRCASTPRQHTVEVCASHGPQQARPPPCQCPVVGASRRCTCAVGPSSRLCLIRNNKEQ